MDRQSARLTKIFDTIKISNAATIRELANKLNVSEMTIRRDLTILEKENLIKLIHGGAVLNPASESKASSRYSLIDSGSHRRAEKMRIGQKAATLLEPGDIIGMDLGMTMECFGRSIPDNLPLTVLCYSLNVLLEVYHKNECKLIFAGGYFHENTLMFESKEGLRLLSSVRTTKAFLAASGVTKDLGITTPDHHEMEAKSTLMKNCRTKILLVDSSKFGVVSTTHFADISDFDIIISDTEIPSEYEHYIRDLGITLYLV
jgi:DeoR family transcriptional regulator, deoxyribose operon repressor